MFSFNRLQNKLSIPAPADALPGRDAPLPTAQEHFVNGTPLKGPFPDHLETVYFALGCFWGAERIFWKLDGVYTTAVGYMAGHTPNPTYQEVCSGGTGHTEAVLVVYDPAIVSFDTLLQTFWESHDPTQGMRQGNDTGTQYRSGVYTTSSNQVQTARDLVRELNAANIFPAPIVTEIVPAGEFYEAEPDHQDYLQKFPNGYTCHFIRPNWKLN